MKVLMISVIIASIYMTYTKGQSCVEVTRIPHGNIKCSDGAEEQSYCDLKCNKKNYKISPVQIYCYEGTWYDYPKIRAEERISEEAKVKLVSLKCEIDPNVSMEDDDDSVRRQNGVLSKSSGRVFGGFRSESSRVTCTKMACPQNYGGITRNHCETLGCCWNQESRSCHAKKCPAPRNTSGISKLYCETGARRPTCKYNQDTSECYQATKMATSCPKGTANPPQCLKITCRSLSSVANSLSVDCTDGDNFNSSCKVTCQKGFGSLGSLSATCEGDGSSLKGTWSSIPTCTQTNCMQIGSIRNGQVTCNNQNEPESSCSITCQANYKSSLSSIYCNGADGAWYDYSRIQTEGLVDSAQVLMKDIMCISAPPATESSRIFGSSTSFGRVLGATGLQKCAKQECHVNYGGITEGVCTSSTVGCCWNAESRTCHKKLCSRHYRGISRVYCESNPRGQAKCTFSQDEQCILAQPGRTRNVVKIPKTYHWEADLSDGSTKAKIEHEVSKRVTGRMMSDSKVAAEAKNLVSTAQGISSEDSFWMKYRKNACHYAGVAEVDIKEKDSINITLAYNNEWDLFHTFSISNTKKSIKQLDMLMSVVNPTSFVLIKFHQRSSQNIKERRSNNNPNGLLNSGLQTITLRFKRATSSFDYSVQFKDRLVEGTYEAADLFNEEDKLMVYINRASDYKKRPNITDPKRGFGLCHVKIDAS